MALRLGCHVSALKNPRKAPYEEAVNTAASIGFDGVELIAMDREELEEYYTPRTIESLRQAARAGNLDITQFAVYSTACEGMASLDPHVRDEAIGVFARGIRICADLGCNLVNLVSHWPIGLKAPIAYPPGYIHPNARLSQPVSPKLAFDLPSGLNFDLIWRNYVESLRIVTAIAADHDVRFAIEGHAQVIVSGADAMLRLFDQLDHPSAVVNLDTSWHFLMREYLPLTVYKLRDRLAHVQCRDSDGLLAYGLPPGQGVVDWHGFVAALYDVEYDGYLSLELSGYADNVRIAARSRDYLSQVIADVS